MSYQRGLLSTIFTSASFSIFGVSDLAARLPTVIFGTLAIPLGFYLGKFALDRNTGILLALAIAFSPWLLYRTLFRYYTELMTLYMASVIFSYFWIKKDRMRIRSKWLFALFPSILAGYFIHKGILVVLVLIVFFLFVDTIIDYFQGNLEIKNKYHLKKVFVLILSLVGLIIYLFAPRLPINIPILGFYSDQISHYWEFLAGRGKLLYLFFPLGTIYLIFKKGRKGIFIVLAFLFAFLGPLFHPRIDYRYVQYAYPFYLLICLVPISFLLNSIEKKLNRLAGENIAFSNHMDKFGLDTLIPVLIAILFLSSAFPITYQTFESPTDYGENHTPSRFTNAYLNHYVVENWISQHADKEDIIISTEPHVWMWHGLEIDHGLGWVLLKRKWNRVDNIAKREKMLEKGIGSWSGLHVLRTKNDFEQILRENKRIWTITIKPLRIENFESLFKNKIEHREEVGGVDIYRLSP